jgi:hypothetical protein
LTAKSGENLAQPFPSVKKDALDEKSRPDQGLIMELPAMSCCCFTDL